MKVAVIVNEREKSFWQSLERKMQGLVNCEVRFFFSAGIETFETLSKSVDKFNFDAFLIGQEATLQNLILNSEDKKPSLSKWKGSRIGIGANQVPAFVMPPIANFWGSTEGRFLFEQYVGKLNFLKVKKTPFSWHLIDNVRDMNAAYEELKKCWLIAEDIETASHMMKKKTDSTTVVPCFDRENNNDIAGLGETWISCVSFTGMRDDFTTISYILPLMDFKTHHFSPSVEAKALEFLADVNKLPAAKIFHNGSYDQYHLLRYRAPGYNWFLDTMHMHHAWYAELDKALHFCASWLCPHYYFWKEESDHALENKDIHRYWEYNALDTYWTMQIFIELISRMPNWAIVNYQEYFRAVYPYMYCAFEGLKIDNDKLQEIRSAALKEVTIQKQVLCTMAADPNFNPASSKQVSELLYDILGAARPPRAKSATASGKKERIFVASQHPLLAAYTHRIDKFQLASKAITQYCDFIQWHGRLLYSISCAATETNRDASRKSAAWVGAQIQNQPGYTKKFLIADPDFVFFELDLSKAEAVCTSHLAQCQTLIDLLYDTVYDFYKRLGVMFFKMNYEEVSDYFRNKVLKKIQHGTNYMMGADTFIDNLDDITIMYAAAEILDIIIVNSHKDKSIRTVVKSTGDTIMRPEFTMKEFADYLLSIYHVPFPEIKEWWGAIKNEIKHTGMLVSPLGHTRVFFGDIDKDHKIQRSGVAHQPQNLSVTLLKRGIWKFYQQCVLPSKGLVRLKASVHDSVVFQAHKEIAVAIGDLAAELIKPQAVIHGRVMTIGVDIEASLTSWKDKEKWSSFKNTLSMSVPQKVPTFITAGSQPVLLGHS